MALERRLTQPAGRAARFVHGQFDIKHGQFSHARFVHVMKLPAHPKPFMSKPLFWRVSLVWIRQLRHEYYTICTVTTLVISFVKRGKTYSRNCKFNWLTYTTRYLVTSRTLKFSDRCRRCVPNGCIHNRCISIGLLRCSRCCYVNMYD